MSGSEALSPAVVRIRCRSWEHFAELFSSGILGEQVFLPAPQPLPRGSALTLTFELPDASEISLEGEISATEIGGANGERPGMWLAHTGLTIEDAERVDRLLHEVASRAEQDSFAQAETGVAVRPKRRGNKPKSVPLHELVAQLHNKAFDLGQGDDYDALGVDRSATDDDIRRAYLELSKVYHPHRYARHGSEEARKLATDIFVHIQAAYGRLTGSQRVPQAPGPRPRRIARSQTDVQVSNAVALLDYRQYDAAIEALREALDDDPDHEAGQIWLQVARGRKYKAMGELQAATQAYRAVLELDASHVEAAAELEQLAAKARVPLLKRWLSRGD